MYTVFVKRSREATDEFRVNAASADAALQLHWEGRSRRVREKEEPEMIVESLAVSDEDYQGFPDWSASQTVMPYGECWVAVCTRNGVAAAYLMAPTQAGILRRAAAFLEDQDNLGQGPHNIEYVRVNAGQGEDGRATDARIPDRDLEILLYVAYVPETAEGTPSVALAAMSREGLQRRLGATIRRLLGDYYDLSEETTLTWDHERVVSAWMERSRREIEFLTTRLRPTAG